MKLIHKGYCAINEIGCCSCGAEREARKMEEHRDFTHICYGCGWNWLGDGVSASCPKCQSQVTSYRLTALADIEKQQRNPERETVNHPPHYTFGKYEVIDVLEDWFAGEPHLWQVGKYIARATRKGEELEDLKKARWFLERKIAKLEKASNEKCQIASGHGSSYSLNSGIKVN